MKLPGELMNGAKLAKRRANRSEWKRRNPPSPNSDCQTYTTWPPNYSRRCCLRPDVMSIAGNGAGGSMPSTMSLPIESSDDVDIESASPAEAKLPATNSRPSAARTRRRTVSCPPGPMVPVPESTPSESSAPVSPSQTFADLVRKASAGDQASLTELRRTLDERPDIWQRVGDVSLLAERAWIDLACSGNSLLEESIRRQLVAMKSEIAGAQPSPIEKILIDLIGVTWLASFHSESATAQPDGSAQQATIRLRRAESAQRRFLRAIKTLATLRALVPHGLLPIASPRASK